jgi:hypothetical protein
MGERKGASGSMNVDRVRLESGSPRRIQALWDQPPTESALAQVIDVQDQQWHRERCDDQAERAQIVRVHDEHDLRGLPFVSGR